LLQYIVVGRFFKLRIMIVLKYTKTYENCPKGCEGISYLHDDQEHKTCCKCNTKWNRIENKVVDKKPA
jgi:hypothetical protein